MADSVLTDPLGRVCTLSERTWERHILVVHPDMDGGREAVEEAISNPNSIWISRADSDVRIYFTNGPKRGLLIAVQSRYCAANCSHCPFSAA